MTQVRNPPALKDLDHKVGIGDVSELFFVVPPFSSETEHPQPPIQSQLTGGFSASRPQQKHQAHPTDDANLCKQLPET